jgi:hypothetical protein
MEVYWCVLGGILLGGIIGMAISAYIVRGVIGTIADAITWWK